MAQALGRTVKLGRNSIHDKLDNHVAFARSTAALFDENQIWRSGFADALKVLAESTHKFQVDNEMATQTKLLESQLHFCKGEKKRGLHTGEFTKNNW